MQVLVETSPFVFAVADLEPGVGRDVHIATRVDWELEGSTLAGDVTVDLAMSGHAGGVMVTGVVEASFDQACNRCLRLFENPLSVRFAQDFVTDEGNEYMVIGDVIDTEPMLRDELLLAVPLVPICRTDCKGLCPECGTDLNTNACSGHEAESVSPFAELRSLFDQE